MKKIISILLVFVMSSIGAFAVYADNDIPPYDYSSFVGEWHKIDPDGLNGDVPLRIDYVKNNKITFSLDNGEHQTRTISNNQVKWTEERYDGSIDLTLTFHDDYIHLQYSRCQEEWYPEITFVSNTCKPRKITTGNYSVVLNGNKLDFEQPPIMCGDRVLVPLRKIFETLGATVEWDNESKAVTAMNGNRLIDLIIGYPCMGYCKDFTSENEFEITLDAAPILYNGYTLVPVRAVSEAFDANVDWNGNTQTVVINTNK